MDEFLERLAKFDLADLASGVGGLQLCPENVDQLLRLEFLASAVGHVQPPTSAKPSVSLDDWGDILRSRPLISSGLKYQDEIGTTTQEIQFLGNCFVAFSGLSGDTLFIVRRLLSAITYNGPGKGTLRCGGTAIRLALGVLALGDAVAKRAGLIRGVESCAKPNDEFFLPEIDRFVALRSASNFTTAEMTALLEGVGLKLAEISPIVLEGGKGVRPTSTNCEGSAAFRPILKVEQKWIVVSPISLLDALRNALIRLAILNDEQDELAFRYCVLVTHSAKNSLERFGMQAIFMTSIEDRIRPFKQGIFRFDNDKILHLVVACDSFEGYDSAVISPAWENDALVPQIAAVMDSAYRQFVLPNSPFKQMIHLVVFQGIGRASSFGFEEGQISHPSQLLLLTADELKVISLLEKVDQLTLWKFAQASEQVRARCRIISFETLNEFGMYRERLSSYYLTDEYVPDVIQVLPGHALKLRRDAQSRWDFHSVVSPNGNGLELVALDHHEKSIPIYASYPPKLDRPLTLVEQLPVPVWVEGDVADPDGDAFVTFLFVETLAYWIWQFSPALKEILRPFLGFVPSMRVVVRLLPGEAWQSLTLGADSTLSAVPILPGTVRLTIGPAILTALATADNAGERMLVAEVLRGLMQLRNHAFPSLPVPADNDTIKELINRYAPLGRKKKLSIPVSTSNPALIRNGLPEFRQVQEFDEQQVGDLVGDFLIRRQGMAPGHIPEGDRVNLLNAIVNFLYLELQNRIAALTSEGLLENLVALNERIIYEHEHRQLTIPMQIACYGSFNHRAERLRQELPNTAAAGVASRFLIEYVVARPPQGDQSFSIAAYDRLLAIAKEIINLASISDGIHHKLDDRQCELLASGRLGFGQSGYLDAVREFVGVYAIGQIRRAGGSFDHYWATTQAENYEDLLGRIDIACKEEFGYTFRELATFLKDISHLGLELQGEPKVMPWPEFVHALGNRLEKDWTWIEAIATRFTLESRPDFLVPPQGFVSADVMPWKVNRELSYIRRPLLIRLRGQAREVIWGARFVDQAGQYFVTLCSGGRLKAKSAGMRKLMGKLHNEDGDAFNLMVAEIYRKAGRFVVRDRVDKLGEKKLTRANGEDLGDIDVLVADPSTRQLFAVEAKAFSGALTPAELSNELAELFGVTGKRGAAQKHLERTEWVRRHLIPTLKDIGLDTQDHASWKVIPLIVLERELISPFLANVEIEVISQAQLRDRLSMEQEAGLG